MINPLETKFMKRYLKKSHIEPKYLYENHDIIREI